MAWRQTLLLLHLVRPSICISLFVCENAFLAEVNCADQRLWPMYAYGLEQYKSLRAGSVVWSLTTSSLKYVSYHPTHLPPPLVLLVYHLEQPPYSYPIPTLFISPFILPSKTFEAQFENKKKNIILFYFHTLFHTVPRSPDRSPDVLHQSITMSSSLSASPSSTSSISSASHPYLSDRGISSIESWKETSKKAKHASSSKDKMSDPNIQAYLEMKKALYSKRSG